MEEDDLVEMYRAESEKSIKEESEQRINSSIPMKERIRLRSISLIDLVWFGIFLKNFVRYFRLYSDIPSVLVLKLYLWLFLE